jgi:peptide/nickel transport system permease protein
MALFLLLSLGYGLRLFPTRGAYTPLRTPELSFSFIADVVQHAILPGLAVVVVSFAGWVISSRSLIISILGEDYLVFAKAKGLRAGRIFRHYALRNALLPQVTGLGMSLGFIVNGAYLVENFFAYPGMGWVFVQAIAALDYNVIQGIVFISITAVLTANLLIDLVLPLVDPRVQLGGSAGG